MAAGIRIWRFDGPPPCSPDDPCLDDAHWPEGLVADNPAVPFGPNDTLRAVFDRHLPGIRWNAERHSGFFRRGSFQFQVILPGRDARFISLAIDEWGETLRVLRRIEADCPDWYTTWHDGMWLRDVPASPEL